VNNEKCLIKFKNKTTNPDVTYVETLHFIILTV